MAPQHQIDRQVKPLHSKANHNIHHFSLTSVCMVSVILATSCPVAAEQEGVCNVLLRLSVCLKIFSASKSSPKREAMFKDIKKANESECIDLPSKKSGIRVLCPTRWTVRAEALGSVINNYSSLLETFEAALETTRDTDTKACIRGVAAEMTTFTYLFGNIMSCFWKCDDLLNSFCMSGTLFVLSKDNCSVLPV